ADRQRGRPDPPDGGGGRRDRAQGARRHALRAPARDPLLREGERHRLVVDRLRRFRGPAGDLQEAVSGGVLVGRPVRRVEDAALLTGRAEFLDDLTPPGTLYAAFQRSPLAAAELDIGPPLPTVLAPNAVQTPRPLLAAGVVRFVGEPVAMVAADTPYRA